MHSRIYFIQDFYNRVCLSFWIKNMQICLVGQKADRFHFMESRDRQTGWCSGGLRDGWGRVQSWAESELAGRGSTFILVLHHPSLRPEPSALLSPPPTGKRRDAEDAKKYICKLYEQQAITRDKSGERKTLYPHFTCATDTNSIRRVFSDVKDTVLLKSLRDYGVIWSSRQSGWGAGEQQTSSILELRREGGTWRRLFFNPPPQLSEQESLFVLFTHTMPSDLTVEVSDTWREPRYVWDPQNSHPAARTNQQEGGWGFFFPPEKQDVERVAATGLMALISAALFSVNGVRTSDEARLRPDAPSHTLLPNALWILHELQTPSQGGTSHNSEVFALMRPTGRICCFGIAVWGWALIHISN